MKSHWNRRDLLKAAGLGAASVALPAGAARAIASPPDQAPARKLLMVFLRGGNDALNTVIPGGSAAQVNGCYSAYQAIRPGIGLRSSSTAGATFRSLPIVQAGGAVDLFGELHPALLHLQPIIQAGRMSMIHRVGSFGMTLSHFTDQQFWETGRPLQLLNNNLSYANFYDGWITRLKQFMPCTAISLSSNHQQGFDSRNSAEAMAHVRRVFGNTGAGVDEALRRAFSLKRDPSLPTLPQWELDFAADLEAQSLASTLGLATEADGRNRGAAGLAFATESSVQSLVRNGYTQTGAFAYPVANTGTNTLPHHLPNAPWVTEFGSRLREAAALLRTSDTRVVGVELGGWDHHSNQIAGQDRAFGIHQQLLATLASGLRAFYEDAIVGNTSQNILVLVVSEFSRTSTENPSLGTDHGVTSFMLAMGQGINPVQPLKNFGVYADPWYNVNGQTLTAGLPGAIPPGKFMVSATDYRAVFAEMMAKHFGLTAAQIDIVLKDYAVDRTYYGPAGQKLWQPVNYLV